MLLTGDVFGHGKWLIYVYCTRTEPTKMLAKKNMYGEATYKIGLNWEGSVFQGKNCPEKSFSYLKPYMLRLMIRMVIFCYILPTACLMMRNCFNIYLIRRKAISRILKQMYVLCMISHFIHKP